VKQFTERTSHLLDNRNVFIGANAMRSFLALGLLITLCASANAATVRDSRTNRLVFIPRSVALSFAAVPARPPIYYNDTPRYDDPSRFGGGEALPVR